MEKVYRRGSLTATRAMLVGSWMAVFVCGSSLLSLFLIQQRARELARSGKFIGSRAVAFEVQFEPSYAQAFRWIHNFETQDELDQLCSEARTRIKPTNPEAA